MRTVYQNWGKIRTQSALQDRGKPAGKWVFARGHALPPAASDISPMRLGQAEMTGSQ
jgi:hypothetical protein